MYELFLKLKIRFHENTYTQHALCMTITYILLLIPHYYVISMCEWQGPHEWQFVTNWQQFMLHTGNMYCRWWHSLALWCDKFSSFLCSVYMLPWKGIIHIGNYGQETCQNEHDEWECYKIWKFIWQSDGLKIIKYKGTCCYDSQKSAS